MTLTRVLSLCLSTLLPAVAAAQDIDILVAPRGTPANEAAAARADDRTVFAENRIHRAFQRAAEHMAGCGVCTVSVRLAAGAYTGRGDTGMWLVPEIVAPGASLRITGGWDDAFKVRAPFDTPSLLVSNATRSAPVLRFDGRRPEMAELVVSGLVFDTAPSNRYDAQNHALLRGGSSTWPQISFGYLKTRHLVIADNVFMNAPEGVGGPLLTTPDEGARLDVVNNVFFNAVTPWVIPGGASSKRPEEIAITGNSFVLNWPRNPDPTTSNPGALEIGNNYATDHVLIERNIFAWNMGGAIFSQWDHDRSPPITIRDNLFWRNGLMYGATETDDGAMVGKFNGAASYRIYDPIDLEDDFDWTTEDNVSFDPGFRLEIPELQTIRYGDEYRGADTGAAERVEDEAAPALSDDAQADVDDFAAELAALLGEEDMGDGMEAAADDADDGAPVQIIGPDNSIRNYAPALPFNRVGVPMPGAPEAADYGASPERIWQGG